ncbi:carboxylesterase family protein [Fulvivirga maritima]|uniref:alpha/beta hydrolase n=1 Tax=Fulvivirga maritima TaxID=2904247 RepID=UPI001F4705C6|nr:alpha/beta hydrolase [Fulvivirga maritima]UII28559.1 carboxylesterase family protein [Fulvivirga maritima]
MRRLLILAFASILVIGAKAQSFNYEKLNFEETTVSTVTYAHEGTSNALKMDVYEPEGDKRKDRPVFLYVHGGGFSGGARDEAWIKEYAEQMAKHGLVVVSMSYTLLMKGKGFGCDISAAEKIKVFNQAGEEVAMAAASMVKNKDKFNIDPDKIILAGSSAGAEAILHAAYIKANYSPLPEDFHYAGVISMAGAVSQLDDITKESAIPTQIFHGTCDDAVPYGTAAHHYCKLGEPGYLTLFGGRSIADKLQSLDQPYYMVTGCNGNHGWHSIPMKQYNHLILDFIQNDVINGEFRQIHQVIKSDETCGRNSAPSICD